MAYRTSLLLPRPPPRLGHSGVQPRVRTYVLGATSEGFREGGHDAVHQGQRLLRLSPQQHRDSAGDWEDGVCACLLLVQVLAPLPTLLMVVVVVVVLLLC